MGPAGTIERGTVVVRDGRIVAVGADVAVPAGAQIVDASGGVSRPGFIASDSTLGAVEVQLGRGGRRSRHPQPRRSAPRSTSGYGLNPDSILLSRSRASAASPARSCTPLYDDRAEPRAALRRPGGGDRRSAADRTC